MRLRPRDELHILVERGLIVREQRAIRSPQRRPGRRARRERRVCRPSPRRPRHQGRQRRRRQQQRRGHGRAGFLATLDASTKAKVTYAFTDNQSRQTWSNYPSQQVPRKGVALSGLSTKAKAATMAVVKTMLSAQGYSQVEAVQKADDWLKANSASGTDSFGSDTDYYLAVYGTPSTTSPFMVQFGGHHLARNYTYKGTTASITPDFTGTEPKTFTVGNTTVQPLKEKARALFSLFDSLTSAEDVKAKLSATVNDILMGPGVDSGKFPTTEGLRVSSLSAAQKKLVLAAIAA